MLNTAFDEPHIPQDVVLELLQTQLRNSIAPLALEVDCVAVETWEADAEEPFLYQNWMKELRAWHPYIHRRPLNRLWINQPFRRMDAASLTEFMHALGQNFKIVRGRHVEHAVTLSSADITQENIALLKGLEFNHVLMEVTADMSLEQLQTVKKSLQEFKFPYISVQLAFDSRHSNFTLQLMEFLSFIEPSSLSFDPTLVEPLSNIQGEGLTALLMQFGYFLKGPNIILKFHSPLLTRPTDCICLGPRAISHLGSLRFINFNSAKAYHERLHSQTLPMATCR